MSGGRLPAALFMVFLLDSKGAKSVNLKSCRSRQELSHEYVVLFSIYYFTFKNWLRHSRALQGLPKPSKNLEKKLEQT